LPPVRTRKDSALLIASNALPVVGVIVFDWGAAPAVFMIWLEALISNLQFCAEILASARRLLPVTIEGPHAKAQRIGAAIGKGIAAMAFCSPAMAAGVGVYTLLEDQVTGEALSALLAEPGLYLWLFVELGLGAYRIATPSAARGYRDLEHFREVGIERFVNLLNRCAVLMGLAWLAQGLGRFGLIAFLAAATAFTIYVEQHENWLTRLQAKAEAAGRARRARRRH